MSQGQNSSVCELIPGQLSWFPEASCVPVDFKGKLTSFGDLVGEYRIPHYTREACGCAFGPLGLDETLKFCLQVRARLNKLAKDVERGTISKEEGVLSIRTSPNNTNERTNAAVMIGAYLILFCNWKVEDVAAALGQQDSSRLFICSWSRKELEESSRTLSVRNCWEGLHLALQQGWLECVKENDDAIQKFLQEYASISKACDAAWIIPSQLLVCADPVTTIYDPNPETIKELFPSDPGGSKSGTNDSPASQGTSTTASTASQLFLGDVDGTPVSEEQEEPPPEPCTPKSRHSVTSVEESVSKEYKFGASMLGKVASSHTDFASFLRANEIRLIVRANYLKESGMPPPAKCLVYNREKFKSHGVNQVDVQFVDLNGAVPSRCHVHKMLRCCKHYMSGDNDAVVVHCKGGFGRSIVLAACLAIERFDIPGSALLGWMRMARPGSVNTVKQERFLASLQGRADVLRYAGGTGLLSMPACCLFS
eukprot:TRINITY_DN12738_c0_g5_i1.p1 TRINITY_DN12738_c0_g5~~TRINITY_DN12738_c0_g5_i1.p1  ORF type:complete len:481 (-),score=43.70 TRINITY_DN12738_c0_g5_i1:216-1658(-)